MVLSEKKYGDPSNVLNSLVDNYGQSLKIGNQEDIGEFNLNFLERVSEGLEKMEPEEDVHMAPIAEAEKKDEVIKGNQQEDKDETTMGTIKQEE